MGTLKLNSPLLSAQWSTCYLFCSSSLQRTLIASTGVSTYAGRSE